MHRQEIAVRRRDSFLPGVPHAVAPEELRPQGLKMRPRKPPRGTKLIRAVRRGFWFVVHGSLFKVLVSHWNDGSLNLWCEKERRYTKGAAVLCRTPSQDSLRRLAGASGVAG